MAQSIGGTTTGSALFCDSINSGFISLSGQVGSVINWQSSINNGASWITNSNFTSLQSYNNLKQTTSYRAVVKNGSFIPDTSSISTITVYVHGSTGTITGGGVFCNTTGNGTIGISGYAGTILNWQFSINAGSSWSNIASSATSSVTHSSITQNTLYRAIIQTYSSCPNDTSSSASISIDDLTIPGTILNGDTVCNGINRDTLKLVGNVGSVLDWYSSIGSSSTWTSAANTTGLYEYQNLKQQMWYKAIVKNGVCSTQTTVPVTIAMHNITPANAGSDKEIIQYESIALNGSGNGDPVWSPANFVSNPNDFNATAFPNTTTTFTLTLSDKNNCISFDTVTIKVIIPIPTAITPNGDGINDVFIVDKIEQYDRSSLMIFNRWGNIVFNEAPYINNWDGRSTNGKALPDDTYYYILDYGNGDKPSTNYILINR